VPGTFQPLLPTILDHDPDVLPIDEHFDVGFADLLATKESYNKHLYRPNTYLHKWWARRCGTTFRLILKHLVTDPARRDYYAPGGLEGKIVLDPMMGGGTTLHEAIRLGANVIGVDIDPIPVLQARASLTDVPLARLEEAFDSFYETLRRELAGLYRTACPQCGTSTELRFTLYGAVRRCNCGPALFVDSLDLRHNPDGSVIRLCARCHAVRQRDGPCGCAESDDVFPIVTKGTRRCPRCGEAYREETDAPFYARYRPVAVVGECPQHGLFFAIPGQDLGPVADFAVVPGPKSKDLVRRGVRSYLDLFSSRQLLYLARAIDLLPSYEPIERLNLALLVSTSLEFNSMLCGYKGSDARRPGAIRHTFSHHAYSFPHTALENNPLYPARASGTLQSLFYRRIVRARRWARQPEERRISRGKARKVVVYSEVDLGREVSSARELADGDHRFLLIQGSSASLDLEPQSVDYVVTDPPYFDSVQYGDLAAFFRVWLRRMVPEDADWEYDLERAAVDQQANGDGQYARVLGDILTECHRMLKRESGRLIFTFHHWNPKGWAALTVALKRARFRLVSYYVVHAENPASVHIKNLRSLKHDAILVLAPIEAGVGGEWRLPEQVDATDSRQFCADCASALGWMLSQELDEEQIERTWGRLLA